MSFTAILSERALHELQNSWQWYEDRQDGLGDRFEAEVFRRIGEVVNEPGKGMNRRRGIYEMRLTGFPFLLIYRIDKKQKQVFMSSIFHTRRNPKKKYSR